MQTEQAAPKQKLSDGYGAIYHRIYSVTFPGDETAARQAFEDLKLDPNRFSPQLLATFEKTKGSLRELANGDEFHIHITGPWDGPVRVKNVAENSFCLATLDGHLEAGEIDFRLNLQDKNKVLFEIESIARSRDAIVDLFYDKLPIAKMAQTEMWSAFCQSFAEHATELFHCDKVAISEVNILTERRDEETGQWQKI